MAVDIRRAWKDPEYRKTLTPEELASLPPNPAGDAEVSDEELTNIAGGMPPTTSNCQDSTDGCI